MNEQELRQQIDMFFKGELSDTEEQGLRDYLATHEVPEDFIQEKRIILSLIPDRSVHIPDHLEEKLSSYIDRLPDKKRQILFSRNWKWISGIAAGIILAISTGLITISPKPVFIRPFMPCILQFHHTIQNTWRQE